MQQLLLAHLPLQRFNYVPDLQPDELLRLLAAADPDARQLLATQGYFSPTLALELDASSNPAFPVITLTVEPGPQTIVASANITLDNTSSADTAPNAPANDTHAAMDRRIQSGWSLPVGQPFTQTEWDSAKAKSLRQLQVRRYPGASLLDSRADIDADNHKAALSVTYNTGPVYRFGTLQVEGSQRYAPDAAQRLARLPTGSIYSEEALLEAQQRLANSGYYDAVFLSLDTPSNTPESATVTAKVQEAKLQKLIVGVGASTDNGVRLSLDHTHNSLPWLDWRAQSSLSLDRNYQSIGTEWSALPDWNGWRWYGAASAQREVTGDYDVNSGRLRGGRSHSSGQIDRRYFAQYDYALAQGIAAPPSSASISVNYGWTARYFNNNTAPVRGYGLSLEWGLGTTLTQQRTPFMRTLLRWQGFVPTARVQAPNGQGRNSRFALRAEAGAVMAQSNATVPVTQLFLTGGDTSVRGYSHRSIGTQTADNQLYGGRYLATASVEWLRPIVYRNELTDFESAVFMDAGVVTNQLRSLPARVGIGAGIRWRSPVGPLQADVAYGVQAKQLRVHVRLGFTF